MANFFDNATGWQTIDLDTGNVIGGGTFPIRSDPMKTAPGVLPAINAGSIPFDWAKSYGIDSSILAGYGVGGNAVKSSGGAGVSEVLTTAQANPLAAYATPNVGGGTVQQSIADQVGDYFLRAVIIVLGFIFVGVGLKMMAPNVVTAAKGVVS